VVLSGAMQTDECKGVDEYSHKTIKTTGYLIHFASESTSCHVVPHIDAVLVKQVSGLLQSSYLSNALNHASINSPLMVSPLFTLLPALNTMKNTIDDANHIINGSYFIFIIQ